MPRQPDTVQTAIAQIEYHKTLNGLKDRDLYERAKIPKSTYWERMGRKGQRTFDLYELGRIAGVLKVTVADLVTRQERRTS